MLKWGLVSVGFGSEKVSCPWVESVFSAVLRASPLPSMPGVPGLLCLSGHHAKRVIFLTAFFFPYTVCP